MQPISDSAHWPGRRASIRPDQPANNIGLLRLLLAAGVIVGHAPELIDGNRGREPLTRLFGTLSLGEVCVDGFFLISGYLITRSAINLDGRIPEFLKRRVCRIYPGFAVAFLLSAFGLGSLVGGHPLNHLRETFVDLAALQRPPDYPGIFAHSLPYSTLNGAMWTIAYEFRCYLLVACLALVGLLKRPAWIVFATVTVLMVGVASLNPGVAWRLDLLSRLPFADIIIGSPIESVRFVGAFLVGACVTLYATSIRKYVLRGYPVVVAVSALIPLLFIKQIAPCALVTVGAIPFFWLAIRPRLGWIGRLNSDWDISYGIYLYGWPVSSYILWSSRDVTPLALATETLLIVVPMAAASWWGIERRFKDAPALRWRTRTMPLRPAE